MHDSARNRLKYIYCPIYIHIHRCPEPMSRKMPLKRSSVGTKQIRYVDGTPTSEITLVIIWYIHPFYHDHTKINIMVTKWWLTSFLVNRPSHFWGKALSNSDLETWSLRSWMWSKGKVMWSAQHINSFPFHFTSIIPTIPEIYPKQCLTLKKHIRILEIKFAKNFATVFL